MDRNKEINYNLPFLVFQISISRESVRSRGCTSLKIIRYVFVFVTVHNIEIFCNQKLTLNNWKKNINF